MGLGDLFRQFLASRKSRLDNENARMMAFVHGEAGTPVAADPPVTAPASGSETVVAREETVTRPDRSVMHTRVERHEEFRVVGPDGSVAVYDRWEDLPAELQAAALKRS